MAVWVVGPHQCAPPLVSLGLPVWVRHAWYLAQLSSRVAQIWVGPGRFLSPVVRGVEPWNQTFRPSRAFGMPAVHRQAWYWQAWYCPAAACQLPACCWGLGGGFGRPCPCQPSCCLLGLPGKPWIASNGHLGAKLWPKQCCQQILALSCCLLPAACRCCPRCWGCLGASKLLNEPPFSRLGVRKAAVQDFNHSNPPPEH